MSAQPKDLIIPLSIVSKRDIAYLTDELEQVDNERTAASVRKKVGGSMHTTMTLSKQLTDFLEQNRLSITESHERTDLIKRLHSLKENIPVIHMTFAVPADHESLLHLAKWLRKTIHPQAVIDVGLQPALVAGVSVRTPNRVHDLSMRTALREYHDQFVKELEVLRGKN